MYKIESTFPFAGFGETKIGGRPDNQDLYGFSTSALGLIVTVCDGMGGMQGGATASALAVKTIIDDIMAAEEEDSPEDVITDAICHANERIIEVSSTSPELQGMGTTTTVLLANSKYAWVAHVGDSRIYQLRGRKKIYRSFDDSLVFQYVQNKTLTEEQARLSSNSNVILKALGVQHDLEFEVERLSFQKGDRFVLCTDGFWGNMPERDFLKLITAKGKLDEVLLNSIAEVESAGARNKDGHFDNLTAAIIECLADSESDGPNRILNDSESDEMAKKHFLKTPLGKSVMTVIIAAAAIVGVLLYCNFHHKDAGFMCLTPKYYQELMQSSDTVKIKAVIDSLSAEKTSIDKQIGVIDSLRSHVITPELKKMKDSLSKEKDKERKESLLKENQRLDSLNIEKKKEKDILKTHKNTIDEITGNLQTRLSELKKTI